MPHLAKYRLAFDITPVPMMLASESGRILLANDPFCHLFEYTLEELEQMEVEALMPQAVRSYHPNLRNAFFRVPGKRPMGNGRELNGVTRTGRLLPLDFNLEMVRIEAQTCALLTAVDLTERFQREAQLRQALDATATATVLTDDRGRIVSTNAAAKTLLGYAPGELPGQPVSVLVPRAHQSAHEVYVRNAISERSVRGMADIGLVHAQHKSGTLIPVDVSLTRIETPEGWQVMSTLIDLRAQIKNEADMRETNARLASLNDELSQFAYSASHDLKAPLVSVMGLLRICLEDLADGSGEDLDLNLRRALQICERGAAKVESILEIARAGKDQIAREPVALAPLVDELWTSLAVADPAAELTIQVPRSLTVTTEAATLSIVLDNLLSNAFKYRDPEKAGLQVTVDARKSGGSTRIMVQDNGCGIAPRNINKIFEMFQRFDARSGAGLGLALVQKHVQRLGGTICVSSAPGQGTTMTLTLPDQEVAVPEPDPVRPDQHKETT